MKKTLLILIFLFLPFATHAATEFTSIVDPDNATGTDYTSLSSWESGVQTDLTAAATQVFSGTKTSSIADNATVYLCRSGAYQTHYGTVVHVTATQILIESITGAATEASGDIWYTNNTCNSSNYFTLSNGGDSAIAVASARSSSGTADTTAVSVDGWTTSATNYIKVWTDPGLGNRHNGKWDNGKYRIEYTSTANYQQSLFVEENYVKIEGLQLLINTTYSTGQLGVNIDNLTDNDAGIEIASNIITANLTGAGDAAGIGIYDPDAGGAIKIYNNIIYNFLSSGIYSGYTPNVYLYNNTVFNNGTGINRTGGTIIAKNNLAYNNTTDYSGSFDSASTYNITNDTPSSAIAFGTSADSGTTTSATANKLIQTGQNFTSTVKVGMIVKNTTDTTYSYVTAVDSDTQLSIADDIMASSEAFTVYTNIYGSPAFEDSANYDFHLDSSDTVAKNKGANLYADGSLAITTDIDGNARPNSATLFDIGADENIAKIYRSIGPSATSAIITGTTSNQANHLTVSGLYATFELPLADNIGVGDAIQYDSDNDGDIDASDKIVFIDKRLSSQKYRVKTVSGAAPTATTAPDIDWSLFRAYTSLSNAEAGTENTGIDADLRAFDSGNRDIVTNQEQWNFAAYANGTTADSTAVTIDGWTTSADAYIKVYTPTRTDEVGTSQRHSGVWTTSKYYMSLASGNAVTIQDQYVNIDGLQIGISGATGNQRCIDQQSGGTYGIYQISNNILKGVSGTGYNFGIYSNADGGSVSKIWNNVIYDIGKTDSGAAGIRLYYSVSPVSTAYAYNNTVYNISQGFNDSGNTFILMNNISYNNTDNYYTSGGWDTSAYNLSGPSSDGEMPSSNARNGVTVTFADTSSGDFHLSPSDAGAKNYGADLTNDSYLYFNTDIDSTGYDVETRQCLVSTSDNCKTRPYGTTWDIGADEVITPIYRSVGPSATSALATGSGNNLTISGSTATFASALPVGVGVGDAIQYDDDNDGDIDANDSIAFITGRTSSTVYTVKNSAGATPTATAAADQDWSIFRAYTTLANAETGTENTGIDDDLENFDTWSGGRDIKANGEQWNIAAYANGTTADTTAVAIDGWTTSPTNYIKVYTPYLTTEVGTSQRHQGKWDDNRYKLEITAAADYTYPISIADNFVKIDGLQILLNGQSYSYNYGITASSIDAGASIYVSNNIIRATNLSGTPQTAAQGIRFADNDGTYFIWNNIIYDFNGTGTVWNSAGISHHATSRFYVFNNIVANSNTGFLRNGTAGGIFYAKNNISYNNTDNYSGTFDSSSTNNLSGPSQSDAPGSNPVNAATVTFADETNDDFHLSTSDTAAKDSGADLSNDPYLPITTDIDSATRYAIRDSYDIGADEVATSIYRSVGPSASSALASGASNYLNISGSTATFDTAPGDNIGVGDALEYDANNSGTINAVAFITGRTSSTVYTIKSATGGTPIALTAGDEVHWNIFRSSTSLSNAEAGTENTGITSTLRNFDSWSGGRDIATNNEQWNIAAYANGTTADSATAGVGGGSWITSASNYQRVYTPTATTEVGTSQRHAGKWDTSKYRIEGTGDGSSSIIIVSANYARVDGLQLKSSTTVATAYPYMVSINSNTSNSDIQVSNNVIQADWSSLTAGGGSGITDNGWAASNSNKKIWNNIIYYPVFSGKFAFTGINTYGGNAYVYNNTIYNAGIGIQRSGGAFVAKNNITQNCTDGYNGTFDSASDYNISDIASDAPNATYTAGNSAVEVKFTDESGKDFHLDPTDIAARNAGANLSADTYLPFSTDIDGKARNNQSSWDIGADEAAKGVYYSVGQNTTDHKSGSPTITISGGLATFSEAQTATNLGVGDKVTYNTTSVAYLLRKVDTTHWYLVTATGGLPADVGSAQTVDSIAHAYSSLSAAEAGAADSDHLNATDLATNDYQLNFPAYYDSGADTTAVTVDGWTTGANNFIKIYTPNTTTEANSSQRHQGKWDDGKYRLDPASGNVILVSENYVRIDGLQIDMPDTQYATGIAASNTVSNYATGTIISNNLIRGTGGTATDRRGLLFEAAGSASDELFAFNNIIYDIAGSGSVGVAFWANAQVTVYFYNNTIINCTSGMTRGSFGVYPVAKNNIIRSCATSASGTFAAGTDYNATDNSSMNYTVTGSGNTHDKLSQTFAFVDATNDDFHLATTDTAALDAGANLSADASLAFTTDIDGNGRSLWDIGADEGSVEAIATVMQSGGDYSTLSSWESGMQTDLTAAGTKVFSGTLTSTIADNASLYLCRSGTYQNITGTTIHATSTQAFIESISSPAFVFAASDIWYTNSTCNSANYFTISTAGGNPAIATAKIDGAWTGADTTAVTIDGWTTGPTNYVKIYTATAARHQGKWDTNKYRLEITTDSWITAMTILEEYARIDGLQVKTSWSGSGSGNQINAFDLSSNSSNDNEIQISNNIIWGNLGASPGSGDYGITFNTNNSLHGVKGKIWNNIIYGYTNGNSGDTNIAGIKMYYTTAIGGQAYIYNNTAYDNNYGIYTHYSIPSTLKNNLSYNNLVDYYDYAGGITASSNNLSSDATSPDTSYRNKTVSFIDSTNKDFHLASTDTAAKDSGTDLSADANLSFSTDIDSNNRPSGSWDIGADETATQIYRSVGPSATSALATGSGNNLTISGSTATFATALADNIGVGDAVQYDDDADSDIDANDSIVFITARASGTSYTVKNSAGAAPTAVTNDQDWSIFRAYTTLANAETGTENTGIDADLVNFDTWSGGRDLVTNNEQWNIAAYANGTTADSTAVVINGWTTSPTNYIKVYTPYLTTEVGTSQRHQGKWDDSRYRIALNDIYTQTGGIENRDDHVRIEGLQIKMDNPSLDVSVTGINNTYLSDGAADIRISNNIIYADSPGGTGSSYGINFGYNPVSTGKVVRVWNNLIYGYVNGTYTLGGINVQGEWQTAYIYNNTFANNYIGIRSSTWGVSTIAKNNIVKGSGDTNAYVYNFAAGTDYNATDGTDSIGQGSNNKISQTFIFADEANDDFHLAAADTAAKNSGIDLLSDAYLPFDSDIDGENRSGAGSGWDIGADEQRSNPNPVNINRSVEFKPGTTFKGKQ